MHMQGMVKHTLVFVPMPRSVSTKQWPSASRMAASIAGDTPAIASTLCGQCWLGALLALG